MDSEELWIGNWMDADHYQAALDYVYRESVTAQFVDWKRDTQQVEQYPIRSMANSKGAIYDAIGRERQYQDAKWRHNPHTVGEWLLILEHELGEAKVAWVKGTGSNDALCEILQVISVGVACLEEHGIVERHVVNQQTSGRGGDKEKI